MQYNFYKDQKTAKYLFTCRHKWNTYIAEYYVEKQGDTETSFGGKGRRICRELLLRWELVFSKPSGSFTLFVHY